VEDRKKMSQRLIDKVPMLAVEMIEHGGEISCLSEVQRGNEEFDREGFRFFCSGYADNRKIRGVGVCRQIAGLKLACRHLDPHLDI
jgi:hypothetical protein